MRLIHHLFQRGLPALLALFEKEGGSNASAFETGDLNTLFQNDNYLIEFSTINKIITQTY